MNFLPFLQFFLSLCAEREKTSNARKNEFLPPVITSDARWIMRMYENIYMKSFLGIILALQTMPDPEDMPTADRQIWDENRFLVCTAPGCRADACSCLGVFALDLNMHYLWDHREPAWMDAS